MQNAKYPPYLPTQLWRYYRVKFRKLISVKLKIDLGGNGFEGIALRHWCLATTASTAGVHWQPTMELIIPNSSSILSYKPPEFCLRRNHVFADAKRRRNSVRTRMAAFWHRKSGAYISKISTHNYFAGLSLLQTRIRHGLVTK